jgi:hypothetical protein
VAALFATRCRGAFESAVAATTAAAEAPDFAFLQISTETDEKTENLEFN